MWWDSILGPLFRNPQGATPPTTIGARTTGGGFSPAAGSAPPGVNGKSPDITTGAVQGVEAPGDPLPEDVPSDPGSTSPLQDQAAPVWQDPAASTDTSTVLAPDTFVGPLSPSEQSAADAQGLSAPFTNEQFSTFGDTGGVSGFGGDSAASALGGGGTVAATLGVGGPSLSSTDQSALFSSQPLGDQSTQLSGGLPSFADQSNDTSPVATQDTTQGIFTSGNAPASSSAAAVQSGGGFAPGPGGDTDFGPSQDVGHLPDYRAGNSPDYTQPYVPPNTGSDPRVGIGAGNTDLAGPVDFSSSRTPAASAMEPNLLALGAGDPTLIPPVGQVSGDLTAQGPSPPLDIQSPFAHLVPQTPDFGATFVAGQGGGTLPLVEDAGLIPPVGGVQGDLTATIQPPTASRQQIASDVSLAGAPDVSLPSSRSDTGTMLPGDLAPESGAGISDLPRDISSSVPPSQRVVSGDAARALGMIGGVDFSYTPNRGAMLPGEMAPWGSPLSAIGPTRSADDLVPELAAPLSPLAGQPDAAYPPGRGDTVAAMRVPAEQVAAGDLVPNGAGDPTLVPPVGQVAGDISFPESGPALAGPERTLSTSVPSILAGGSPTGLNPAQVDFGNREMADFGARAWDPTVGPEVLSQVLSDPRLTNPQAPGSAGEVLAGNGIPTTPESAAIMNSKTSVQDLPNSMSGGVPYQGATPVMPEIIGGRPQVADAGGPAPVATPVTPDATTTFPPGSLDAPGTIPSSPAEVAGGNGQAQPTQVAQNAGSPQEASYANQYNLGEAFNAGVAENGGSPPSPGTVVINPTTGKPIINPKTGQPITYGEAYPGIYVVFRPPAGSAAATLGF